MPDGRKRILGSFTRRKKRKAWNKTREKYIPVKRRQNLPETDKRSHYKEEWLEKFLDSKGAFTMVMKVIIVMRVVMKIMNSSSHRRVLPIAATK